METGMIVTTTILIALCASPFFLIGYSTKKRENQLKKELKSIIAPLNGAISEFDIINDFIIGLDSTSHKIYFYKKAESDPFFQEINLNNVRSCEIEKSTNRIKKGKSFSNEIQNIALLFTLKNKDSLDRIELYDYNKSTQINGEIALADKWNKKINFFLLNNIHHEDKPHKRKKVLAVG